MTMPTGPAPRPLPNPGPPPAPFAIGPKPTGPTHPTPTGPPRPLPAPTDRLPSLAQIVGDATKVLNAAIVMLGRQWDPTTGPSDQDDPWGPEAVDIHLGSAVADVRSALRELADIAATIPARQSTNSASLPGGPPNHPVRRPPMCPAWEHGECECHRHCLGDPRRGPEDHPDLRPGEGLSPGLAAGFSAASARSDRGVQDPGAGSNHLASSPASGGLLPGLADAAVSPTAGGTGESNTTRFGRDAGESSDPRPVARSAGPDGHRREAGVGFALPQAKRFVMPGTERIARAINEALTGRSW